jgi:hypothetical protein
MFILLAALNASPANQHLSTPLASISPIPLLPQVFFMSVRGLYWQ